MITKGNFYISVINLILYSSFLQPYHLPKCGMFTFYPSGWHWYYSLPHCFVNPYFSEVNWPPSPGSCSDFVPIKAIHLSMLFLITVFFLQVLLFILKLSLLPPASFSFDSPYFHVTCLQFQGFTYIRINHQTSQKLHIQLTPRPESSSPSYWTTPCDDNHKASVFSQKLLPSEIARGDISCLQHLSTTKLFLNELHLIFHWHK